MNGSCEFSVSFFNAKFFQYLALKKETENSHENCSFISSFGYALKWGIYGIWTGLPLGLLVICIGLTIVVLRIDWIKESINARERSEKPGESVDMKTLHDEENAPLAVSQDTDDTSIALENDEPSIKT